ncbi:MAG: hypothetical protein AAGF94_17555 [Pseudomonadota bacterium]
MPSDLAFFFITPIGTPNAVSLGMPKRLRPAASSGVPISERHAMI